MRRLKKVESNNGINEPKSGERFMNELRIDCPLPLNFTGTTTQRVSLERNTLRVEQAAESLLKLEYNGEKIEPSTNEL
jgi:hypothetical protein